MSLYMIFLVHVFTVDVVIFACLNIRKFLILEPFTMFRIRDFFIFF